jgi:hypothetical protein
MMTPFLYFDAGIAAMIVQGVVAAAAAVILFSKNALYKIKLMLGLVKESDYDSIDIDDEDTPLEDE